MARLSNVDPIEKFRFEVTYLTNPTAFSQLNSLTGATAEQNSTGNTMFAIGESPGSNPASGISGGGFSEAVIPKANVTEINYRENTYAPSPSKIAGMVRYDNLVLKRGVTSNKELYNWLKTTNNNILGISAVAKSLSEFAIIPTQTAEYRTDLVLSARNREGKFVKHWVFYNCFVASYKPGNDFDAQADSKLIEEVSVSFEQMVESNAPTIQEVLEDVSSQISSAIIKATVLAIL